MRSIVSLSGTFCYAVTVCQQSFKLIYFNKMNEDI